MIKRKTRKNQTRNQLTFWRKYLSIKKGLQNYLIPNIENYIHPIDIEYLQSIEDIVELVLKNYDKKLEQSKDKNLFLKHKEIVIKLPELASLFKLLIGKF